jgi:PAS domain S-box-containing protein
MDVTDRHQAVLESARLAAIVTSSDDAIVTKTLEGVVTSWNEGAARIFGYEAEEMIGQSILRVIPKHLHPEEHDILARLRRGEHIRHYETVRVAKDGRQIDISVTISPLRDSSGKTVGASKVARDITERKQADKLQRLLMDELNHRVKNTLATIQAIASQSLRRSKSPGDFVSSFSGRVQSLARAHDLLTQTKLQGAEIKELVHEQVVYGGTDDSRISFSGPSLMLDAQAAVHLALVLHELATNARKYGALSTPNGHLAVNWELQTNGGRKLILDWKESGGPTVTAPKERGFGSTLIEKTLQSHGGEVSISYAANGVSSRISMPLPASAPPNIAMRAAASTDQTTHLLLQPSDKHSTLQGKRIIVIEDEPLVAMDLESNLVAAGCEIAGSVGTIEKARALIANAECDAALIDANLAGCPVDELAAALTQKNIPFAFVTGYGRMALPLGFRDVLMLNKPFGQEQLLTVMEVLLYRNPGVAQLRQKQH